VAGTAVAAAAMAALSASQAPGFFPVAHADAKPRHTRAAEPPGPPIDGGSPYITDMPPLNTPTGPPLVTPTSPGTPGGPVVSVPGGTAGLPATVLAAYQKAAASVARSRPGCHLPWQLLAAIGQVESGQARGGSVDADGTTYRPILGPVLNGNGFASISDTDGGRYDGDARYDRAVGPMQFIPSTWARWGADGNSDGVADPNNVFDAALAAAHYLCADGRDLSVPADMDRAILGYNHSEAYLRLVKAWYEHFVRGTVAVPDRPGTPGAPHTPGTPAAPGTPGASGAPASTTGSASPSPTPPGSSPTPSASTTPTAGSTGGGTSAPPTGGTTTAPPTSPSGPSTPPSTTPTDPTTPPTTPGCASPTPSETPTGTASPSSPSPSTTPTEDPCATDSPSPTPSGEDSASPEASASAQSTP
jgi:hypothetical protein